MIERGDLEMTAGKLASQAVHSARLSLLKYLDGLPDEQLRQALQVFLSLNSCGSAVTIRAKNLSQLLAARDAAAAAGLPWALFTDTGHVMLPHFTGEPVITALAIGPASRPAMRSITKKFRCTP